MTMLYRLDASAADIARQFSARAGDDPWEAGHVAPGSFAPVITAGREIMPVILPPDRAAHDLWLRGEWGRAQKLVAPYSSSLMTMRDAIRPAR